MSNPYTPPESEVTSTNNNSAFNQRSSTPKVIGIISLVLAGIGIMGALGGLAMSSFMPEMLEVQERMGFSKTYIVGSNIVSLLASCWVVFIGLKLIKYQDIGRRHFNYYTVFTYIMSIFAFFYTRSAMKSMFSDMKPEMAAAAQDLSSMSSIAVFIAPILITIAAILLNKKRSKESLS